MNLLKFYRTQSWSINFPAKKILAAAAALMALAAFHLPAFAFDQTEIREAGHLSPEILRYFTKVPVYYLELPFSRRFVEIIPDETSPEEEPRRLIRLFLDRRAAEVFRNRQEELLGKNGYVKKISLARVLRILHARAHSKSDIEPELAIFENLDSPDLIFYYLNDIETAKPYALQIRKKKAVPIFLSLESAQGLAEMAQLEKHARQNTPTIKVEALGFKEFLTFLKTQEQAGIPARLFPYASRPVYTTMIPMTWGVGSSYLFGTILVLFLFWAITRSPKKH